MHTVYLAIGANVGDKKGNIAKAVSLLQEKIYSIVLAPLYETTPWGFAEQENFLNTALRGETDLSPENLLTFVKEIEEEIGRVKRFTNGPREIDIDIILYESLVYSSEILTIPHPRMQERDFVLQPLSDIASEEIHPVLKKSMEELLKEVPSENLFVVRKVNE